MAEEPAPKQPEKLPLPQLCPRKSSNQSSSPSTAGKCVLGTIHTPSSILSLSSRIFSGWVEWEGDETCYSHYNSKLGTLLGVTIRPHLTCYVAKLCVTTTVPAARPLI